jgi:hypothetical protein
MSLADGIAKRVMRLLARHRFRRLIETYEANHPYRGSSSAPEPIRIEPTFDAFVSEFGGKKVAEQLTQKANLPKNADYFFLSRISSRS